MRPPVFGANAFKKIWTNKKLTQTISDLAVRLLWKKLFWLLKRADLKLLELEKFIPVEKFAFCRNFYFAKSKLIKDRI